MNNEIHFNSSDDVIQYFENNYGYKPTNVKQSDNGGFRVILNPCNFIEVPSQINSDTELLYYSRGDSSATNYAHSSNTIVVHNNANHWNDEDKDPSGTDIYYAISNAEGNGGVFGGFSNGGRVSIKALSDFLGDHPDASHQTIILTDSQTATNNSYEPGFTNIKEAIGASDIDLARYKANNTTFILVESPNQPNALNSNGIQRIINNGNKVICISSPYGEHANDVNYTNGICTRTFSDGIVDWAMGKTSFFNSDGYKVEVAYYDENDGSYKKRTITEEEKNNLFGSNYSSQTDNDISIDPLTFESARQCLNRANQILDGMITTNNMDQSFLSKLDKGTTFNTASFKSNWQSGCANLYSRVTNVIEAITAADATQASLFDKYKSMDLAGLYASVLQEQTGVTKPQTETTPTETKPTDTQSTAQSNTQNTNSNSTGNQTTNTTGNTSTQSGNTTGGNTNSGGSTTGGYSGGYSGGSSSSGNSSGGSSSHSGGSSSGSGSGSGGSSSSENTQTQKPETKPVETKPTELTQTETKPQEQVQVKDEELEKYEQEELEIEKEKLEIEKERLELEKQRLEHERNKESVKIENNNVNNNTFGGSSNGNGKTDTTSDTNQNTTSTNKNGNIVIENNNINNNVYNAPSSTSGGSTSKPSVSRPSTNTTPSVNNTPTVNTPVIENTPSIEDTPVVELPSVENNDNFFVTPGGLDTPEIPNVEVISPIEDIKPVETITPTVQKSSNNTGLILGAAAATAAVGAAAYGAYKYTKKKEEETGYAYEDKDYDSSSDY